MAEDAHEGPPLEAWRAWTPQQAAQQLEGTAVAWCVVGGWAIDLFLGAQTRPHEDLEIAIARGDWPALRARLAGHEFYSAGRGEVRALAPGSEPPADAHQVWVCDPRAGEWRLDVMLEPGDVETWVFRRDPAIRGPRAQLVGERGGVAFLAPAAVLLFKAKYLREKDRADFAACLPRLDGTARAWLREALARCHPGHPWLEALA